MAFLAPSASSAARPKTVGRNNMVDKVKEGMETMVLRVLLL